MLSPNKINRTLQRTAALLCAAVAGLGLLTGPLRAQSPVPAPNPSPAVPTPYSSPVFHAGGALTPPPLPLPLPIPFPDPLYTQLQGTPTGLVPGTGVNAGATVSTEIPSFLLGNYLPTAPPAAPGVYFPNHFRDGTIFSWSAPLTFLTPNEVAPASSATGAAPVPNVESTPTAVNVTEFPFIKKVQYTGTLVGTASTPDPTPHSGGAALGTPYLIRQLVYFGRAENVTTTTAGGTTTTPVGAIYCVDGFTGEVVWRYQTPTVTDPITGAVRDGSVFSTPAVAYINVLVTPAIITGGVVTTPAVYANKAVVVVGDNNGFVYCLDATGNGDGTSNSDATSGGQPIYGAQPVYPATVSATTGPHVGTTDVYWIYRPDATHPQSAAASSIKFDPTALLPVPGPFGIASPNVYVDQSISTTPDVVTGALDSNAVIYLGNTRDCVYALDGLGVPNNRTASVGNPLPAYNASLPAAATGISDLVPTCSPRWWFTPDNAAGDGVSFESTPALSPPTAITATVLTADVNPVQPGNAVTFTATVTNGSSTGPQPAGTVTFTIGGVPQTVTLVNGVATAAPVVFTTAGSNSVTAVYTSTNALPSSSTTFDEEVDEGAGTSATVVTSSANPSTLGQSVTFTATVSDGGVTAGPTPPTGTVTFSVDGVAQPAQTLPGTAVGNTAALTTAVLTAGMHTITAAYSGDTNFSASATSFQQIVFPLVVSPAPIVYIGSSQELGTGSNAGRLYAIDGLAGPALAGAAGGAGHTLDQRAKWAFPNLYAVGQSGNVGGLPVRPALGDITGSPVVFTNTDDVVAGQPRTRIYFAANSGLEVPFTAAAGTGPNPRPAADATGRVWAVNLDGTTATTTEGATTTVWSFPEANDPNKAALDATPEPSAPIGAFLNATPAMGFVQFPAVIEYGPSPYTSYTHTDTVNTGVAPLTDVKGKAVPMLYIGTTGASDLGFYAVDVDGSNDTERGIYRLESPTGSPFQSSPVLVANSSTAGGNGGAVYATAGNDLLQFTATPISNVNAAEAFPFVGVDATFSGGGPISGPAVAAADVSDLSTGSVLVPAPGTGILTPTPTYFTLYGGANVTDFVYFGDGTLGFCRGITPIDPNYGGAVPPTNFGGVTDTNPPQQFSSKFFLQAYLFDGSPTHAATTTDMTNHLPLNPSPVTGFEWGGFLYVRIGNVVPPGFNYMSPDPTLLVADPTDTTGTTFYGNGQAVNFSIGSATVSVPPTVLTTLTGAYPEAGFIPRTDPAGGQTEAQADASFQLVTFAPPVTPASTGYGWIAAYSYPVGSAQTRIGDTPGGFRRIRQATQIATIYTATTDATGAITYTPGGTISLNMQTAAGSQFATGNPPTAIAQTPPSEQPTFGILNPLAVQGLGVPLPVSGTVTTAGVPVADPNGAGPFGPITSPTAPTQTDLAAFANGSNYLKSLPPSGYDPATEDPTQATQFMTQQQTVSPQIPITIATSVGDIRDGSTGDNLIPGSNVYGLEAENRSLVGISAATSPSTGSLLFPPLAVAMQKSAAHWNDNTQYTNSATYPQNTPGGPGATINPLPWEDWSSLSSVNTNASLDYPDIPASDITHTLVTNSGQQADLNSGAANAFLDGATGTITSRANTLDHIRVGVFVPRHQPANLQVWDGTAKIPLTPDKILPANAIFPQGYIEGSGTGIGNSVGGGTPQRVFVDVSGQGRFNTFNSPPYRDVQSFAGVPVDMKTIITNGTVSLGKAPSSLGTQTEQSPLGLFDPYNTAYQSFFQPLTVQNDGNTNLLNVQFNQQLNAGSGPLTLSAQSDGNDPLSALGGFDYSGTSGPLNASYQRTYNGTAIPLPGTTVAEQSFLFRTSLDTDLMLAYGRNPGIIANDSAVYPAATFHKPRAGSAQPTTLTVPDMPDTAAAPYSLPTAAVPTVGSSAPPYVGISLPFGTPVGSYHTTDAEPLRLFEGMDLPSNSATSEFSPPTYGSAVGGHVVPSSALTTQLPLSSALQPELPVSDPGVQLQITALEDRMTDGFTFGALPMIDTGPAIAAVAPATVGTSTPDFAPAAFRDPVSGDLSVYWTSGRIGGGGFGIYGANVPFNNGAPSSGDFFYPKTPATNWFAASSLASSLAAGTNSGLSITPGPGGAQSFDYAFDVAVSTAAPYSAASPGNTLYSYSVAPATGAVSTPIAVTPASDASQVKYGVKGLYTGFTNPLWAFWTASTRGRTTIDYNSQASGGAWGTTVTQLPIPAGLTAVADASPMLMQAPVNGALASTIEVTYSGAAPDGNVDLYVSRYVPHGTTAATAGQLDLVQFPAVTEDLRAAPGGWYQSRDVAWSRTGALNISVNGTSLLYSTGATPAPLFTKAIYDNASGLLVLTGVKVPSGTGTTTNTVYVDAATGRIRFSPALLPATQNFAPIRATFSPLARRLTLDSRADTAPVTFLDDAPKANDAPGLGAVTTDRRWTIWRKSGVSGDAASATLYFKAQRLTFFLPSAIDPTKSLTITLNGASYTNPVDVDYERGRLYFPIASGAEGETATVTYTAPGATATTTTPTAPDPTDTVEWQDEPLANNNDVPAADSASGLDTVIDNAVPLDKAINENNVAAFLDPFASATVAHKVWLFWNSTRNGTADIYSETIDPRFAPGP